MTDGGQMMNALVEETSTGAVIGEDGDVHLEIDRFAISLSIEEADDIADKIKLITEQMKRGGE